MSVYLPAELYQQLLEVDDHCCAHCRTTQSNSGQPMVVDHIISRKKGGKTEFKNLCFACRRCNEFKGPVVVLRDPLTGELTPLFHPRQQQWSEHFAWDSGGVRVVGLTAIGRVTIIALNMNNDIIIDARQQWVSVGWHPPL
ncbi:MAG: HNH endonuclease [Chloroflexi bacterium]|nr:HNH endonuclease [Chloroflexota bacterium]MCI0576101.1 HNH endonuclease [Chloroflexota bacterium]MCI0647889.1 HNH endonuclease [Chloroflexota bacterium]MCI0727140.1 HNH endonuclease [Chloroflexota bacterium]